MKEPPEARDKGAPDHEMGFFDHLDELRRRILLMLYGIVACMLATFYFGRELREFLLKPIADQLPKGSGAMITIGVIDPLLVDLKVSFVAAFFLASPWVFYQVWRFVAPGLYPSERKLVIPFVLIASVFFVLGGVFAYTLALPAMFRFAVEYMSGSVTPMLDIRENIGLVTFMLLAFGAIFETPVIVWLLTWIGVVTPEFLASTRRYAVFACFVLSALVTPTPDAVTATIVALPMIVLYEMGIQGSRLIHRTRRR
ncbi:MAG: Sec-independent protein translocase protein TatC [Myxococcota bacterium]|nr:Sec-independent protein translocase protein TatC [Myxococcota bacterium]